MTPAPTATALPTAGRLACVGVDLGADERVEYARLTHHLADLHERIDHSRGARRAYGKTTAQRQALLRDCVDKRHLIETISPSAVLRVVAFAIGTVEDPRDPSYDGFLDDARRSAVAHQVFPRGASAHAIDAFLDSRDWIPDPPAAPPLVPPVAPITPVVVHNVLPATIRSRWHRKPPSSLISSDVLPPFVRLSLPHSDFCDRCGSPRGWMRYCEC